MVARLPQQLPALRYQGDPLRHRLPAPQHRLNQAHIATSQAGTTRVYMQCSSLPEPLVVTHGCISRAGCVSTTKGLRNRSGSISYLRVHPLLWLLWLLRLLWLLTLPLRLELQPQLLRHVLHVRRGCCCRLPRLLRP